MDVVIDTSALVATIVGEPEKEHKDGRTYSLVPEKMMSSPLDVPSVKADISTQDLVDIIREGRDRGKTPRSPG